MSFLFPTAKQRSGYAVIKPSTSSSSRLTDLLAKCVSEKYSAIAERTFCWIYISQVFSIFRTSNIVSNIPESIERESSFIYKCCFVSMKLFLSSVLIRSLYINTYYNGSNKIRFVERNHYRPSINKVGKLHEIFENYSLFLRSKSNLNLLMHEIWILNIHKNELCPLTKLSMLYSYIYIVRFFKRLLFIFRREISKQP